MSKVVEIINVNLDDVIGAKNTKVAMLTYNNGEKEIKKGILHVVLNKNPVLAKAVKDLKVGDTVELTFDESQFRNIIGISPTNEKPAASTYKPKAVEVKRPSTYVDNSLGMRVGNALTNAVNTLVSQKKDLTVDNIVDLGKVLLEAGEKLTSIAQYGEVITKESLKKAKDEVEKEMVTSCNQLKTDDADSANPFADVD